ncbi:hypothetical protein J6590_059137 [Homalodisca vitripennis]|nr:hypothetical protein J6590_059137 [Homalodisca vitripennis]
MIPQLQQKEQDRKWRVPCRDTTCLNTSVRSAVSAGSQPRPAPSSTCSTSAPIRLHQFGYRVAHLKSSPSLPIPPLSLSQLKFSKAKTVSVILKGKLVRPSRLLVEGEYIRCKKEMKYLGVVVGQRKSFEKHVEVCEKMKGVYATWQDRQEPIGVAWSRRCCTDVSSGRKNARKVALKRKLLSMQRRVLLKGAKAYNTVSHDAIRKVKRWEDKEEGRDAAESNAARLEETLEEW